MVLSRYITSLVMHQAQENGIIQFKTTLRTIGAGKFKPWHIFSKTYLLSQQSGSDNLVGPAHSNLLLYCRRRKSPWCTCEKHLGQDSLDYSCLEQSKPIHGIAFGQGLGCSWWVRGLRSLVCMSRFDLGWEQPIIWIVLIFLLYHTAYHRYCDCYVPYQLCYSKNS